ncbi:hypothetical protein GJ496_005082 [Pomphorhynchus laevis]|nr:hypothetical protein GJ496_005082 [Pomphorhynchus laevis]
MEFNRDITFLRHHVKNDFFLIFKIEQEYQLNYMTKSQKNTKCSVEVVIVIGGGKKGTRFRPLSLELPKPLFPIAGQPIIQHLISQCAPLSNKITGINLIGYYDIDERLSRLIEQMQIKFNIPIRYIQEPKPLGTGGGLFHFRDRILASKPCGILFINGDVYADLPLKEFIQFFTKVNYQHCMLVTKIMDESSNDYGCVVIDEVSHCVRHFVEKPSSFVSSTVNCGVYLFKPATIMKYFQEVSSSNSNSNGKIQLENEIFPIIVGRNELYAFCTERFWGSIKTPSSVLQANSKYLEMVPKLQCDGDLSRGIHHGNVYIGEDAVIHSSAEIGPNVSIGKGVRIDKGVRIKDSIILDNCEIGAHSCILLTVLGSQIKIGEWCRVEGVRPQNARTSSFTGISYDKNNQISDVTVIGHNVKVADEIIIRSSVVLPNKEININCYSEIVL